MSRVQQGRDQSGRRRHRLEGRIIRDDRGEEGYGEDLGGRSGYGMSPERPEGYGPDQGPSEAVLASFGARDGSGRPNRGGQEFGQDFSRREGYGHGKVYGRDYGGWETHQHDFSGRVHQPGVRTGGFIPEDQERPAGEAVPARDVGRGTHAQKGPRGYTRSDERIREDVCEAMTDNADLDATDVEVSVERGEVTLRGTVSSRMAKRLAEDLADSARGVTDVHNELRVRPPLAGGGSSSGELH